MSLPAGEEICHFLNISQLWLAFGEKPVGGKIELPDGVFQTESASSFFDVVEKHAADLRGKRPPTPPGIAGLGRFDGADSRTDFVAGFAKSIDAFLENVPPHLYMAYANDVSELEGRFIKKHKAALNAWFQLLFGPTPEQVKEAGAGCTPSGLTA